MTITQNSCGFLSSAMIDHWAFAGGACTFVHSRRERNCNTGLADYSKVSMAAVPFPIRSGGEVVRLVEQHGQRVLIAIANTASAGSGDRFAAECDG
jgi:hypothetical protein